jgi:hypothetical protein
MDGRVLLCLRDCMCGRQCLLLSVPTRQRYNFYFYNLENEYKHSEDFYNLHDRNIVYFGRNDYTEYYAGLCWDRCVYNGYLGVNY